MFRKKKGLKSKINEAKQLVQDSGSDAAKKISSTNNKIETATGVALVLGVVNWIAVSLFNFDVVQAIAGRKSMLGRVAYGVLGASAVYAAARGGSELSKR